MRLIGLAVVLGVSLLGPLIGEGQQTQRVYRIGFLGETSLSDYSTPLAALRRGLRDAGYLEGTNLVIESRWAEERVGRLPGLAADLVRLKVDLIVTHGTAGSRAAKQATTTIPIVFATAGDAVRSGLVTSFARPGGNMTGFSIRERDLMGKRFDLLKQAAPAVSRIVLLHSGAEDVDPQEEIMAARALGLELKKAAIDPKDPTHVFLHAAQHDVDAIVVEDTLAHAATIAALAVQHRLPTIGTPQFAEAGFLLGYGPSVEDIYRRVAALADKILKGAKPADLPVEQPTKFELVVNLKTAKMLGLTIPQAVLLRADQLIE
jgi:putative tryptophan/tyrosine transport system substrate-binding protein